MNLRFACSLITVCIMSFQVYGQVTKTARTTGPAGDRLWSVAGDWVPSGVPASVDDVIIPTGITMRVDQDNRVTRDVTVEGLLIIQDQRELQVNRNLVLNGTIRMDDNGNIESLGLVMAGAGGQLSGTGTFSTAVPINSGNTNPLFIFNNNVTVLASANLSFSCTCSGTNYTNLVRINNNFTVTNIGRVTINKSLVAQNTNSRWNNSASTSYLNVFEGMLPVPGSPGSLGLLDAATVGNTVEYGGTANQTVITPISSVYHHLILSGSGTKTTAATMAANGNLSVSSILNLNGNNISVGGNWTNTGSFQAGSGSSTVQLTGSTDQTITNSSGEIFNNLTVSKAGGLVLLNNPVQVNGTLNLTNSRINTQNSILTLGASTSQTGTLTTSGTSYIIGTFERWINTVLANTTIPLGTATGDLRTMVVNLNLLGSGGSLQAQFFAQNPGGISNPPLVDNGFNINNTHPNGFWRLTNLNGLSSSQYDVFATGGGFTAFPAGVTVDTRMVSRSVGTSTWTANGAHDVSSFVSPTVRREDLSILPVDLAFGENNPCTLPSAPTFTANPSQVCLPASSNYSVSAITNKTWEVVGGTITAPVGATGAGTLASPSRFAVNDIGQNSITVAWTTSGSGEVRVAETNLCGTGPVRTQTVTINPIAPTGISGLSSVSVTQANVVYSVPSVSGYTYAWTVPSGGTIDGSSTGSSIVVDWGGAAGAYQVQVVATSTVCSASAPAVQATVQVQNIKTNTGTGVGLGSPDLWSDAATWDPPGVPTRFDQVVIVGTDPVRVNIDNAEVGSLTINAGATLEIGDQREINIYGNLTLNGTINHLDVGNIESLGVAMVGNGTTLFGTGLFQSTVSINGGNTLPLFKFDANVNVDASANLVFNATAPAYSNVVRVEANRIVSNFGRITITRSLVGVDNTSTWVNKAGSSLSVGDVLLVSGTLDARTTGNTVEYSGSVTQNVKLPVGSQYGNLVIGGSAIKSLIAATEVTGDLRITSNLNAGTFGLTVGGNWINQGVFQPGTGAVTFNGTVTQSIDNVTGETFGNLIVNKSGSVLQLNSDVTVSGALTIQNSFINTTTRLLTLGTSTSQIGSLSLASAPARILGKFRRWIAASGVNVVFPVGTSGFDRTLTANLNGLTTGGTLTIEFISNTPTAISPVPLSDNTIDIYNIHPTGYWSIVKGNALNLGASSYNVTLNASGFDSFLPTTPLSNNTRIISRPNSSSPWTVNGSHGDTPGSFIAPIIKRSNLTLLSAELAIGENVGCVLPLAPVISSAGGTAICTSALSQTYSVAPTSNWVWEVVGGQITSPAGATGSGTMLDPSRLSLTSSNSINVLWNGPGTGTVRAAESNVCGIGAFGSYSVTVNPIAPAAIAGLNSVYIGQSDVGYSITPLAGYTYNWTLSGGGTIDVPSTGSSITVDWGSTPGSFQVQVSATNTACALSAPATVLQVQIANVKTNTGSTVGAGSPDLWGDANTWSPPGVPTQFDYVVIQGTDPVRVNIDNAEVGTLVVNSDATLEIGDQREVNIYGDLTLNGVISHLDNGNIETTGVAMVGNGTRLFGTGRFESIVSINGGNTNPLFKFDANVTIDSSADLDFIVSAPAYSNVVRIEANRIVTNFGKVNINRSLVGVDANSSVWINQGGAVLKVAESLLATGQLDAREVGNTIEYSGGSAQTIKIPTQSIYGNLTIGGSAVKTMSAALEVRNNLLITSNLNPNNFGLTLGGNWTNQGVFQEGSSTGSVTFNGSSDQLISTVSPEVFNNLTVDKAGGQVRLANNNIVVAGTLALNSGVINTFGSKVTIGTGFGSLAQLGVLTAVAPARVIGRLERFVRNSVGINNSVNLLFPIGTANSPRNFTITFNDAAGSVAGSALLEFVETNPGAAGLPLTESSVTVFNTFSEGFWRITSANGLVSTNYSVNLLADGMNSFSVATARVVARANSASAWQFRGAHVPAAGLVAARNSVNVLSAELALADINNCTPAQTSAITGSTSVCISVVSDYEVQSGLAGSTYTWTVAGGTITAVDNGPGFTLVTGSTSYVGIGIRRVRITWGAVGGLGSVSVSENNNFAPFFGCGQGPTISQTITINPVQTSSITGAATPSPGQSGELYSVVSNVGYTYAWSVSGGTIASGAGTSSVTVNWGTTPGNYSLSVIATNTVCALSADAVVLPIQIINDVFNINTTDADWSSAATWNVNRVPVATDNVRIVNAGGSGAAVRLNIDNAAVTAFIVASGARFIINDQRELSVSGNLVLDGTIDFNDNGNIESTGLTMVGNNTTLDGSGVFRTTVSINNGNSNPLFRFDANVTIPATANLQFTCTCTASDFTNLVRVDANRIVTNFGTISINRSLVGVNNGSQWINRGGARLIVQDQIFPGVSDILDASESGNTVEYSGNATQTIKTPLTSYSNLRLTGSATKELAASINVTGDLTISSNLTTGNNDLTVGGNWTNTGTFVQNAARVVIVNGASNQTISNPVGEVFQNLRVNKTAGQVLLGNDLTVNGTLSFQQGYVSAQSSLFTLGSTLAEGTLDLSSYVEGAFIGRFRRWADSFFPNIFVFPVGTGNSYRPLSLDFSSISTGGAAIVEFVASAPGTNGLPLDDAGYLVSNTFPEGYWRVTSPSPTEIVHTGYSASATANGFTSFAIAAATRLLPRVDSASPWILDGIHAAATGNVATRTSLNSFPYELALGTNDNCVVPTTSAIALESGTECINSSATYSVVNTPSSTYQWTVVGGTIDSGQGSNEIVVIWGSSGGVYTITVQENNLAGGGCGVGPIINYSASVGPLSLGSISGNEVVTTGAVTSYSVPNLPGYTYSWSAVGGVITPSTSNTVNVTWGAGGTGSVSVFATAPAPCSTTTPVTSLTVTIFSEIVSAVGCVSCPWSDAASWDPAIVPQPGSSVRIRGGTSVNLNVDNAVISNLNVETGASFTVNDQRELTVNGNITLNGTVNFNDNGNIESLGLVMGGSGGILDGSGLFQTTVAINNGQTNPLFRFNANVTVAAAANLTFNCTCTASDYTNLVRVDANRIVTNFGQITINRGLAGQASNGQWINKTGSRLSVARTLLPGATDLLFASETGNLVEYNGTVLQDIKTPSGSGYFNLNLNGSATKRLLATGNVLGNLEVGTGVTFSMNNFNLSIGGDFINNGGFSPGIRTVTFNGSGTQQINGITFYRLAVNKPSGSVNLLGNVRATDRITLTQGNVNTGVFTLALGAPGASNGTLTRTNGTIIGRFESTLLTTTPLGTSILFPVGTATQYRPATIAFDNLGGANGSITVEFIAADPLAAGLPLNDGGSNVQNAFMEGYWDVSATGITSTSFDLDLNAAGFASFTQNASNRILFRSNVAMPPFANWQLSGTHVAAVGSTLQRDNVPFGLTFEAGAGSLISCPAVNTSVISGLTDICSPSTADTYSVVPTAGSTYNWTVPGAASFSGQGTNSINNIVWSTGGVRTLQVVETTTCLEVGAARTLNVNVHPVPVPSITGNATVVPNSVNQVYSVPFRNNYCYSWLVTGGTIASTAPNGSQITVNWAGGPSGNVQVVITYSADCITALCSGTSPQTVNLPINITSTFVSTTGTRNWFDPAAWIGGVVPPANANVTISANSTISLTDNSVRVQNLIINSGTPSGVLNNGAFLLTVNGDYTNNGTHSGTGNTVITGSTSGSVQGTGQKTQGTLTFSQSRTIVLGSNLSWSGTVLMNPNVTITNNATVAVTSTGNLQGGNDINSIWVNGPNATLNIAGTFNSGRINAGASNNLVRYSASANQNIRFPIGSPGSYFNLSIEGTGIKTMTGDISADNVTIASGATLATGPFILTINGDLTNNNVLTSTGTVVFTGSANPQIVGGTNTLNNLVINKPLLGSIFRVTNPAFTTIAGELTITRGVFEFGSSAPLTLTGNVRIGASGVLNATNISNLTLGGDFIREVGGAFTPGSNAVTFNSSSSRSINGVVTFHNLTKSGSGALTLTNGNTTVNNQLTLTAGLINSTISNLLVVGSSGTVSPAGGSATSYVDGPLRKEGNSNFVFPIGKAGIWARLGISNLTNTGPSDGFRAEYFASAAPNMLSLGTGVVRVSSFEYWDISRTSGSAQPQVTFHWENDIRSAITQTSTLLGVHYTTAAARWESRCPCTTSGTANRDLVADAGSITTTNWTSFSPGGFGAGTLDENPLPIQLLDFKGLFVEQTAQLQWRTASEKNSDFFEIQRSAEGELFDVIGTVSAAGNSSQTLIYQYLDAAMLLGTNYYRLRMVDRDGSFEFSNVIRLDNTSYPERLKLLVHPNPATNGSIQIRIQTPVANQTVWVTLRDLSGKSVLVEPVLVKGYEQVLQIQYANDLPAGMYVAEGALGVFKASTRIVIVK
jgi:hypothetical protein